MEARNIQSYIHLRVCWSCRVAADTVLSVVPALRIAECRGLRFAAMEGTRALARRTRYSCSGRNWHTHCQFAAAHADRPEFWRPADAVGVLAALPVMTLAVL